MVHLLAALMLLALVTACRPSATPLPLSGTTQQEGQVFGQDATVSPSFATTALPPDAQESPPDLDPHKQSDCPKLDSTLAQIVRATNPMDLAQQLQLTIRDNKIQVLLILSQEDTGFLQDFQVEIGSQVGTSVQAFVLIDQLCRLANADSVLAIRTPSQVTLP
jgi:hypothetical protein